MKTDTKGRRKSNTSQSTGKEVRLTTEYDFPLFRGLRRYYPLPTPLVKLFWKPDGNHYSFQERGKWLNHEKVVYLPSGERIDGPMLERPWELNPPPPNNEPAWYMLTPTAAALAPTDAPVISYRDPMHHRGANACVGASFELLAPSHGMEAIHHEEIFLHPNCPPATRELKNPLQIDDYEPDALFALHDLSQGERKGFNFYVREQNRGVGWSRKDPSQTSNKEKVDKLLKLFASRRYQAVWGIPNLRAMFLMTNQGSIDTALDYLRGKKYGERFLFKSLPQFHTRTWKAPRAPIAELFEPWQTTKGLIDITKL